MRRRRVIGAGLTGLVLAGTPLVASLLLGACGKRPPSFDNLDITGSASFNTAFVLPDTQGRMRSIADYKGKVVVLFFGYTQCPDICPTSLAELAEARKRLGADGVKVQVVFVSVDPQRDTSAILDAYVAAFDPSFVALRPADDAAVAAITKKFHIYAGKEPAPGAASGTNAASSAAYTVSHTAASFVFDPEGKLRLYARDGQGVERWVHDIPLLLKAGAA